MSKRLGLIIGINNYKDALFHSLKYAENDARALAQWLVNVKGGAWSPGDVQLVQGTHATKELVESLITQMCLTLAEPGDLVLLYFAGHAFLNETNADGYLALTNTQHENPLSGLHLPTFTQQIMTRCRASQMLIILDCFQTGPLWQKRRFSPYDIEPLISSSLPKLLHQQGSRLFFCSCRGTDAAAEAGERNLGLFMHRSIVGLSGPARNPTTGQVTLQSLYTHLSNVLGEQQRPKPFGHERSPLILVGDMSLTPPAQQPTSANNPPSSGVSPNTGGIFKQPATATMPAPSSFPANAQPAQQMSPSPETQRQIQFLLNQAQQLIQAQLYIQALNLIEQALQLSPGEVSVLVLKGQLLGTMGHFPEALAVVGQLMQENERNPLVWSMRAVLLTNIGQYQQALESIDHSLALDNNNPETQTIRKNIMNAIAMAASQGRLQAIRKNEIVQQQARTHKNTPLAFLISIACQILGIALGIAGVFLASFLKLPTAIGVLFMGLGTLLLCVNAARSTYRYGWIHLLPPLLTSALAIGIIVFGGLLNLLVSTHTPTNTQLLNLLQVHPSFLIPTLVFGIWLAILTIVPLILALGGGIAGAVRKR